MYVTSDSGRRLPVFIRVSGRPSQCGQPNGVDCLSESDFAILVNKGVCKDNNENCYIGCSGTSPVGLISKSACDVYANMVFGEDCAVRQLQGPVKWNHGMTANGNGFFICRPCPPGTYATRRPPNFTGEPVLAPEAASRDVSQAKQPFVCIPCKQGTFSNETGQEHCHTCPAGTTTEGEESKSIDACSLTTSKPPCPQHHIYIGESLCRRCPCGASDSAAEGKFAECRACP